MFYWAHAWSDHGGLIDVHSHQGFEIMSFVLKGTIEHYNNKYDRWKQLHEGDAQIIRAGNGITHAEKFLPGAHIFQIWVDPDLTKTLSKSASYDDYSSDAFPAEEHEGYTEKVYRGDNGPMEMDAIGLKFKELNLKPGTYEFDVEEDAGHANYIIEGRIKLDEEELSTDDFFQVHDGNYAIEVSEETKMFRVITPKVVGYKTYAQLQGIDT